MKPALARPLLALTASIFTLGAAQAQQRMPLAPVEGEVIVAFKPEAGTLRKHALAARSGADGVSTVLAARAGTLGARVGRTLEAGAAVGPDTQVVRAAGVDAATLARQLAADADVLYAVPNGRKRRVAAPVDPLYLTGPAVNQSAQTGGPASGQWYLRAPTATVPSAINIEAAWAHTRGSANVVVAVLDTGARYDHPDLRKRLLPGYDMVGNATVANDGDGRDADASDPGDWVTSAEASTSTFSGCDASDSSWHGTSTASLIAAATDSVGMAGAAPGVRVLPVRVLGKCFGSDSDIIAGMRWAAGLAVDGVPFNPHPAKVINMSLGGSGSCSAAYQQAINEITAAGVLIVAAAGNSAGHPVNEPANCAGVVGVLALRHAGTKVGFSDLGTEISIAAPGGNCINVTAGSACLYPILAASNSGTRGPSNPIWTDSFNITVGTSFSSPLTAAVAALVASRRPDLTPAGIRAVLRNTARPFPTTGADNGTDPTPVTACQAPVAGRDQLQCYCNTTYCGAGMLDAGAALASVAGGAFVNVSQQPLVPEAGDTVTFSVTGFQGGSAVAAAGTYDWTLTNGGGIVTDFASSRNASTATATPNAAGTFSVSVQVTDSAGGVQAASSTVRVLATMPNGGGGNPGTGSGGGGGGAASGAWVLGVGLAAWVLRRIRVRSSAPRRA